MRMQPLVIHEGTEIRSSVIKLRARKTLHFPTTAYAQAESDYLGVKTKLVKVIELPEALSRVILSHWVDYVKIEAERDNRIYTNLTDSFEEI